MNHAPTLDFALDRAARKRWKTALFAILGLCFGLQMGLAAWRLQTMETRRTALESHHRQLVSKAARADNIKLSPEHEKKAVAVQAMLNTLAVPWESLLQAIEAARTPRILVDAIQPKPEDGSVSITVSSPDFAGIAEFTERLAQQESLQEVMLVSETMSDVGGITVRAVISAHWRSRLQ